MIKNDVIWPKLQERPKAVFELFLNFKRNSKNIRAGIAGGTSNSNSGNRKTAAAPNQKPIRRRPILFVLYKSN